MSWVEEQYTESDAANNRIKSISRKVANRWFETVPADQEGAEGEVRYVMNKGIPLMCVKMQQEWHFTTLSTIGKRGVTRMGDGLDATNLVDYMPNEPHWDSGWKQLVMQGAAEPGGTLNYDWEWAGSGSANWATGEQQITQGAFWENVGSVNDNDMYLMQGALAGYQAQVFLVNHGLGLTKPPKNIACFISNSPPHANWSVDSTPMSNCLQPSSFTYGGGHVGDTDDDIDTGGTYGTTEEAIEDGIQTWYNAYHSSTSEGAANTRSILYGNIGIGAKPSTYMYNNDHGFSDPFNKGTAVSIIIISPNHLLMIPQWRFVRDTSGGINNLEWLRLYVWR